MLLPVRKHQLWLGRQAVASWSRPAGSGAWVRHSGADPLLTCMPPPPPLVQGFKEENGERVGFNTMVYR